MGYRYAVLGAGRQGVALAFDLARNGEAEQVTLADLDPAVVAGAIERLTSLLPETRCAFVAKTCDVSKPAEVAMAIVGAHVVLSAVPYRFNAALTRAAIAARASFCDLGGNTHVVREQLQEHERAAAVGVSVVPDCGLAPGLGNHLAAHGVDSLDDARDVRIRCGGLPERPVGPLGYKLTFSFDGLINEYSGCGEFLRDGRRVEVPALTESEVIEFPEPIGRCEAAVTSGGTSTCPETYAGRLQTYDYKTVRYPGHLAIVRALFGLGCFDERIEFPDGSSSSPKALLRQLMESRMTFPDVRDVVVLRVTVSGTSEGKPRTLQYDLIERHDDATGFSAMERATGFPAALVAHMQARGLVTPGARPLEVSVPTQQFFDELPRRGITVKLQTI